MADGRLDPTPLATLDIYVGRSAPFLWMPASDDGSQEGTLYFQWFDRGSNRIKAFHPSRSGAARWQDLTPAGTNVTAFSISADRSEERRGRTAWVSTGRSRWSPDLYKQKKCTSK